MEDIILYSNGCPKCKVIRKKLEGKNVKFVEVNDEKKVESLGYQAFPILQVDEIIMSFKEANEWINKRGENLNENQPKAL